MFRASHSHKLRRTERRISEGEMGGTSDVRG
jgi:hypothetical protein